MTQHMRAKIRTRNHLYWKTHQNEQKWIDACLEASEAINEATTESWKNLFQKQWRILMTQICEKSFKV